MDRYQPRYTREALIRDIACDFLGLVVFIAALYLWLVFFD